MISNNRLKNQIARIILIIEISSLVLCLLASSLYHIQKLENKSLLFLDAARSDYLSDDSRSLQQKIYGAISSHEFKQIHFLNEKSEPPKIDNSWSDITFTKPILAQTNDPSSFVGRATFVFSLTPALLEGLLAWAFISLILLLVIPLIQKHLANQIKTELETEQAKALATLATQVAHDIRSPLSVVRMLSAAPDLNSSEARDLMNSAAGRIDEIAQDLVDTAKRNKIAPLNLELIDLTKLLNSLIATKQIEFKNDAMIKINRVISDDLNILADSKELSRVISNLINNAAEAKNQKPLVINIKAEKTKSETVIAITDNGVGMLQATIADILSGKHQSSKTGRSGLGLGLKHAVHTIQQMNARFDLRSEVNVGTTITMTFVSK